jgi:peptidoglycan/LPS O-acetylase OafA/YrhL
MDTWRSQHGELGFWACYVCALAICVAVAGVTFLFIEWPFLYLRAQLLESRPPNPPASIERPETLSPAADSANLDGPLTGASVHHRP